MNDRELGWLLMERTTLERFDQLLALVANASEATRSRLADRAITECQTGVTVFTPVNGFILYLLCLNDQQISIELLRARYSLIEQIVYRYWTVTIKGLGPKDAFDPVIQDLARLTYMRFVELTNQL